MTDKNIEYVSKLAPAQQGILFHTVYAPGSGVYVLQLSCALDGPFDIAAFQRAWRRLVERYAALRTAFYWEEIDRPLQVVYRQATLPWAEHDWSGMDQAVQGRLLAELLPEDRARGFDLGSAPLMRLTLIRLGPERCYFLWTFQHLIMDGWSTGLILKELFALYDAFSQGRDLPLPRSRPYRDYMAWLQQQRPEQAESFWRQALAGFTAPTPLPLARAGASGDAPATARHTHTVPEATTAALQAQARRHQLTMSTIVQGAWALLLSRYSREPDVLFGVTVSGRPAALAGSETMVGMFINTLPLRVQVPARQRVLDWLWALQEQQAAMRQHEHIPLVQIQGWSAVPRGVPLFESILVFENYPLESAAGEPRGLLWAHALQAVEQTNYPLSLYVIPGPTIRLQLLYDGQRFEQAAVATLLEQLAALLEGIARDPQQPPQALTLLGAAERDQIVAGWNATTADYPARLGVHELIAAQARRSPNAIAVLFDDPAGSGEPETGWQALSYGELDARAERLADHLRALGVGPDGLVGIMVERSIEMLVGLLGILKAGGAYVPLDPSFPRERLSLMLDDAQVPILLTQSRLLPDLPSTGARIICLDQPLGSLGPAPVALATAAPEHLAYVIYTSGSTGRPKGVQIPHRALTNFLCAMARQIPLGAADALLAVTTLSFDIAALELFLPLIGGARLLLVPQEVAADGRPLGERLAALGATVMQATPATWGLLLDAGWSGSRGLRILCGGEALPRELAAKLRPRGATLINLYGPTETTIWSTAGAIDDALVHIGRPIANTQIYLLDEDMQPVPVGVPGELYIGGDGLARGYLGQPALTAERFIPNPFAKIEDRGLKIEDSRADASEMLSSILYPLSSESDRLYRTGDLARWLPDGTIEHLGRIDHQIKLRGFRIELGEIETALLQHPAVHDAVVIVREDPPGDRRLVAYIVQGSGVTGHGSADSESDALIPELRSFLSRRLPQYMVPSHIVALEAFPRTPNGKLDRRALPAPSRIEQADTFVAPRTPDEAALAKIWSEALGVERVGAYETFFDLGGHSILALQILARVRDVFGIRLSLQRLFAAPTVAQVAEAIELIRQAGPDAPSLAHEIADLAADAQLDPAIGAAGAGWAWSGPPRAVLLTGATGFLGVFLLHDLLRHTDATIYCLVRAAGADAARQKIRAALEAAQLWDDLLANRIVPLTGDLARPQLGLPDQLFGQLAERLDTIYHNGALVNFVYPYAVMRAPNVLGTQEILRLATQGRLKPVHFVSTNTVFYSPANAAAELIREDDALQHSHGLPNGYGESKWVAERLLNAARERGVPVAIYRPGRIAWHRHSGVWNSSDLLYKLIKGCLQLGSAPDLALRLEITPVDYVSEAIVRLSLCPQSIGRAFHLVNPQSITWRELAEQIRACGVALPQLPYTEWLRQLQEALRDPAQNALLPLISIGQASELNTQAGSHPLELRFDTRNVREGLAGTELDYPALDKQLFQPLLAQMMRDPSIAALELGV